MAPQDMAPQDMAPQDMRLSHQKTEGDSLI